MPILIRSEVYVNSLVAPVPFSLCNLNQADLDEIEDKGPYTNLTPDAVLPQLDMDRLQDDLLELQMEHHRMLEGAAAARGHGVSQLTLRVIVHTLLGYSGGNWGGQPTAMEWLPPLKRCDTKSKVDLRRIIAHAWANPPRGVTRPKVVIGKGDGQTNHRMRDAKKDDPELNKGLVVGVGNFHPWAHYLFVIITGWWYCLLSTFTTALGIGTGCAHKF